MLLTCLVAVFRTWGILISHSKFSHATSNAGKEQRATMHSLGGTLTVPWRGRLDTVRGTLTQVFGLDFPFFRNGSAWYSSSPLRFSILVSQEMISL